MIEIFVIIALSKKLAELAQARGHGRGWAALGALFWIGGEVLGFIVAAIVVGDSGFVPYLFALAGAGLGAGAAYLIVSNLSPRPGSTLGDIPVDEFYAHADPTNPYSPSGFGRRECDE